MRLAVLDTNVIVSAGVKPEGVSRALVERTLVGHARIVTCPAVLDEYMDVVRRAKFFRYGFPPPWLELLLEMTVHLPDPEPWPAALPDSDDSVFLALAHASGAWLVTGIHVSHLSRVGRGVRACSREHACTPFRIHRRARVPLG